MGGGVPRKKITEISGVFSVGKSTLSLQIIAQAQKQGLKCLLADTEYSFSNDYAEGLGVDTDRLDILTERFAEAVLDGIEEWAEANKHSLILVDSIGGLLPRAEAEKGAEGKVIGGQAKLIATFCRKIVPVLVLNDIALVVLNHQFADIMNHGKLKTSGGAKLEYSKSIWLMLYAASKKVMKGEQQVGLIITAEIRKNKLAATQKQKTELTMIFGEGFSASADLLQELLDKGEVVKKQNTYYRGETKLGVGAAKAREALMV